MGLLDPDPNNPPLVVLGKPNPRADEIPNLRMFGKAMAHLDRVWQTTNSPGVPEILRKAYLDERLRLGREELVTIIPQGSEIPTHKFVLVFSDKKFLELLTSRIPDWESYHWYLVHNPRETREVTKHFLYLLSSVGIVVPPEDGG